MATDKEVTQALRIRALESQNKELKRRIDATIRYIERATEWGMTYGQNVKQCDDVLEVVVGVLNGDIH